MLVCCTALAFAFFPKKKEAKAEKTVVRVWNIDTFEGGKGSRSTFLKTVAARLEKDKSVYFMIESYTKDGAELALKEGNYPDMLSFGIGFSAVLERCLPLSYRFAGGEVGGSAFAYPWCRGGYALFSREGASSQKTAISCGGENLTGVCAALEGIEGEELDSLAAYVGFLNGNYGRLLGTQRDLCRFQARGVSVAVTPLSKYCDLYQYIAVLSAEKRAVCERFLEELLSPDVQNSLVKIGMFRVTGEQNAFAKQTPEYTASVFSSQNALLELKNLAKAGGDGKNLLKFLKSI